LPFNHFRSYEHSTNSLFNLYAWKYRILLKADKWPERGGKRMAILAMINFALLLANFLFAQRRSHKSTPGTSKTAPRLETVSQAQP
jgi:hypothetical protein